LTVAERAFSDVLVEGTRNAPRSMLVNNKYASGTLLKLVSQLAKRTNLVFLAVIVLVVSCQIVKASDSGVVSFTYGYVWGLLEFPEEVHPTDTVACNLTIGAYIDVDIYNFTLGISGLVGENWQVLHVEQILSRQLIQGENISMSAVTVLPQNVSASLHYVIEASTDKGFGETAFYATYVRGSTYSELQINNNKLQQNYSELSGSYENLTLTLGSLTKQCNNLQTAFNSLNLSYVSLNASDSSLRTNYDSLQQNYEYIKEKYDSSIAELDIYRNLMFGFGIAVVILAATTLYFRKKAPYIVLRKETAVQPDNQQKPLTTSIPDNARFESSLGGVRQVTQIPSID
jgi:hypothetical protein